MDAEDFEKPEAGNAAESVQRPAPVPRAAGGSAIEDSEGTQASEELQAVEVPDTFEDSQPSEDPDPVEDDQPIEAFERPDLPQVATESDPVEGQDAEPIA